VGRTHNVPAQSTTLGRRFAYWSEEFLLALENLNHVYKNYKIKGIKGALGTGSDLKLILGTKWNSVEKEIGKELGIESILTAPSQIYPRSLDFQVVSSLVQLAAPVASIATNVRLMAGLGLINEGRSSDQIGSSAMPHKNNPRLCERIGGLYILLKGYLSMISEITGNQWNEGDVSESVVRRVALAESFYAIDATLRTMRKVLMELEVNEQEIALEIETELQYLLSSEVLVMATKKGKGREAAHQIILECARKSKLSGKDSFFDLLARDGALNLSLTELEDLISRLEINVGDAPEQAQKVLEQIKSEISKLAEFKDIKLDDISN
jgi:adenylosuccinate lyase